MATQTPIQSVQLLTGYIVYVTSWVLNDFETMPVGPCTTLTGQTVVGDAIFGTAFFKQR